MGAEERESTGKMKSVCFKPMSADDGHWVHAQ